ncbi:hypothetical protein STEG23_011548 [Scotinomys teguina]
MDIKRQRPKCGRKVTQISEKHEEDLQLPNPAVAMELSTDYLLEKLQWDLEAEHVEVEDMTLNGRATSFRVLMVSALETTAGG